MRKQPPLRPRRNSASSSVLVHSTPKSLTVDQYDESVRRITKKWEHRKVQWRRGRNVRRDARRAVRRCGT